MTGTTSHTQCRGLRGAAVIADVSALADITTELLDGLLAANSCQHGDVAAALFTLSEDLTDCNPAAAARERGWEAVPLMMVREHAGESMPRCLRVLLLVNTPLTQSQIQHLYLHGAQALRPDLVSAL